MLYNTRTDLALEASRIKKGEFSFPEGIEADTRTLRGFKLESLEIQSSAAGELIGKAPGHYYTLSLEKLLERRNEAFPDAAEALADIIRSSMDYKPASALVVCLGNPDMTPDALGSIAGANIIVTRHMKQHAAELFEGFNSVSLCRTGVLGTTGIESAAHIRALCALIKPELVICVDALAGADSERLCRTVQVTDTGISPGSGVGNEREALSFANLSIPVIAIGTPTVIDAGVFSDNGELSGFFVTPRNIDTEVRMIGRLIGYGINLALHEGLTVSDIDMLLG